MFRNWALFYTEIRYIKCESLNNGTLSSAVYVAQVHNIIVIQNFDKSLVVWECKVLAYLDQ